MKEVKIRKKKGHRSKLEKELKYKKKKNEREEIIKIE